MSGTKNQSKKEMAKEAEAEVVEENQEEQVSYPPVASVITNIFKCISLDETDVSSQILFSFLTFLPKL